MPTKPVPKTRTKTPSAQNVEPVVFEQGDPARIGYARVSTAGQDPAAQIAALERAGCGRVYVDRGVSGTLAHRPAWDTMTAHWRRGDTLAVWRLDRAGRSLVNLLAVIEDLGRRGVGFVSLTETIDTTTAAGNLVLGIFGALSQFERDLTRERTLAGLAEARRQGRVGGRPPVLTPDKRTAIAAMTAQGLSLSAIASAVGVSRSSVVRARRQAIIEAGR